MAVVEKNDVPTNEQSIAAQVKKRADDLLAGINKETTEGWPAFIKSCLDDNERGDGRLYAELIRGESMHVVTLDDKEGQWYRWAGHVWEQDVFKSAIDRVDLVASRYEENAAGLQMQIDEAEKEGKEIPAWKPILVKSYKDRAFKLRGKSRAGNCLYWAPIVDNTIACDIKDLDQKPWLLPCQNGVLDLQKGIVVDGRPDDYLTRQIDVEYNPDADYTIWEQVIKDICVSNTIPGSEEIPAFIKRLFGYAITGKTSEQYIFIFLGPGRNGKGVLFSLLADILGPYYHVANRSLVVEQRTEPPPSASAEHLFALQGKRVVVAAETNKGQKIDAGLMKNLTGEDIISCRKNYGSEINFMPTHSFFIQTNNMPYGLTKEFSLAQRLVQIDFPFRFVDDIPSEEKKWPTFKGMFKQKNDKLKDELRKPENLQGILKWAVEGCLEWQRDGLQIPDCIMRSRDELTRKEDYIGQFFGDVLSHQPEHEKLRISLRNLHKAFEWWWKENIDSRDARVPHKNTLSKELRDRGYVVERTGGHIWAYHLKIKDEMSLNIPELAGL